MDWVKRLWPLFNFFCGTTFVVFCHECKTVISLSLSAWYFETMVYPMFALLLLMVLLDFSPVVLLWAVPAEVFFPLIILFFK
jgi:hypothetical protein